MDEIFEYSKRKPNLHPSTRWHRLENGEYYLENTFYNTNLVVSEYVVDFLNFANGHNSLADICHKLNIEKTPKNVTQIFDLFYKTLYPKGVLLEEDRKIFKKSSYIKLQFSLISHRYVEQISKGMKGLFYKRTVCCTMFITLLALILFFSSHNILSLEYSNIFKKSNLFFCILLVLLETFIHEFGHSSALSFYGKKPKNIGFGFYLLSPVLFADVTNAWKLNNKQRMVVDLGGMYFQFIFMGILVIAFLLTKNNNFLLVSLLSLISILYNLNPFVKTDGYWFVSDLLNMYNLKISSREKLKQIFTRQKNSLKTNDIILAIYGFLSISFVFFFISYMLFWNYELFLLLPKNIENLWETVLNNNIYSIGFFDIERVFLPIITAMIILSELTKGLKRMKNYFQRQTV